MDASTGTLVRAGFYYGHPAANPTALRAPELQPLLAELQAAHRFFPPGFFSDLAAACAVAQRCQSKLAPQGLQVPATAVARLRRAIGPSPLASLLGRADGAPLPPPVAAGHDVLGFGDDLVLSFAREDAGLDLCHRLALPLDPPPFLPDAATARRLVQALDAEELGAPVYWLRCWRSVYSALP